MAQLAISDLVVAKDDAVILKGVSVDVADGELLCVLGPSGSGKTTLLRSVAGLDTPVAGQITIDGIDLADIPPRERDVAMVFQEAVFLPNLDVGGNVAFPLKIRKRPQDEIDRRVGAESRALHIEGLLRRKPNQLSAGEQHLVQIARSLVRAPRLFLMDEPLARLDAFTRERMRGELRMMQRGYGVTTMYVTNDPREAMAVADRIVVLVAGSIVQSGPPDDLYKRPVSLTVAKLMGDVSTVDVRVTAADGGGYVVSAGGLAERSWAPALEAYVDRQLTMAVRPEAVGWPEQGGTSAVAETVTTFGSHQMVTVAGDGWSVLARTNDLSLRRGAPVAVSLAQHSLFNPATGRAVASSVL